MARVASPRQSLLLTGVLGIMALRLTMSGKLRQAWSALWSGGTGTSSAGGSGAGTSSGSSSGHGLFGFLPSWVRQPTAWLSADRGLVPGASVEYNFGTNGQSVPVVLPAGHGPYTLVSQSADTSNGFGGYQVWRASNGGLFAFLHLQSVGSFTPGQTVQGGAVAMSGWPTSPQYAVGGVTGPANAHLAVIFDQLSRSLFGL